MFKLCIGDISWEACATATGDFSAVKTQVSELIAIADRSHGVYPVLEFVHGYLALSCEQKTV